jgi:hypothetical protein
MTPPISVHQFIVYAGYHQFYLQDENAIGSTGADDFWTQEAYDRMLAINPGIIGVGTASYGNVPVTIEIYPSEPPVDISNWDFVMEASIELNSGQLSIVGCPDTFAGQIALVPGTYQARIHYGGLETVEDEEGDDYGGLETVEDEEGDDYYRIFLWLGQHVPVREIEL